MLQSFEIEEHETNLRLDVFLSERLRNLSRSHIQKLIGSHGIRINSGPAKASYKTRAGDVIEVDIPAARPLTKADPEDIPLDILFEDRDLIVVNKSKGMVVHPAPGAESGTLVNAILFHCRDLSGIGGTLRPGIVHRLDKDTSGVIVVAKTDEAHISLAEQIRLRTAVRKYQALLWGRTPFKHAVIDAPVARHPVDRKRMTVFEDVDTMARHSRRDSDFHFPHSPRLAEPMPDPEEDWENDSGEPAWRPEGVRGGRPAVTEIRLLEHLGIFSWVEAILQTGRTHQIRVHLASAGFPVVGDTVYGGKRRVSADDLRGPFLGRLNTLLMTLHGQALHAYSLAFNHPSTGKRLQFHAPLPSEVGELVDFLRRLDEVAG